jgi:alpha-beta hydrolase superfamily lysophospholipase
MLLVVLGGMVVVPTGTGRAQADSVRESPLSFSSGSLTLSGTLALPSGAGPWPSVVIIAGSGPTDRDGNSVLGISPNTYALLARGLADRGIASLRYDKRGLPSSRGGFDHAAVTLDDFAADAAAAARALAAQNGIGPVFLLGHSEGGTLAIIAARKGAPVAGLILVSAAGRDPTTILREQLARQLPPPRMAQFDSLWPRYLAGDTTVTPPQGLAPLFLPVNRRFMQSWQAFRPVETLAAIELPVLVLHGETDVQTTVEDARALGGARPGVGLVILPGVNHVLKAVSGATAAEQAASYTDRTLPLGPGVVSTLAEWVRRVSAP